MLATKVHGTMGPGPNEQGNTRYHIVKACEGRCAGAADRHIDLYQLHRPALDIPSG